MPMILPSVHTLRTQLNQGDEQLLAQVYAHCRTYCLRGLMKQTGCSTEDAEDLFMDALLIFRENVLSGKLERLSNLQSYLLGICLNLWRSLSRARARWQQEQDGFERQLWLIRGEDETSDEDAEYLRFQARRIAAALGKLGETCRRLLTYVYVEQRPHQEIAELMGLASANVVKVTRHRCYQQWLKQLESYPHGA
jgi:RNA polymerase sigma factor (sigma-70 family)